MMYTDMWNTRVKFNEWDKAAASRANVEQAAKNTAVLPDHVRIEQHRRRMERMRLAKLRGGRG